MVHMPLLNKRIVVTRTEEQSVGIVSMLREAGATVLLVPTIKIVYAQLSAEDATCVSSFYKYDVAIFPSANSVRHFFTRIPLGKHSAAKPYIVAIGKKTADAIAEFGITADFIPGKFTSDELMKSLSEFEWKGKKVLIPAGNLSNNEIAEFVESKGAMADKIVVYDTLPNDSIDEVMESQVRPGQFDMIIFYSPSQVKYFINIFGLDILKEKQIAVIGPTTKKAVEHHGLNVSIIPDNSTTEDLISCILEHEKI